MIVWNKKYHTPFLMTTPQMWWSRQSTKKNYFALKCPFFAAKNVKCTVLKLDIFFVVLSGFEENVLSYKKTFQLYTLVLWVEWNLSDKNVYRDLKMIFQFISTDLFFYTSFLWNRRSVNGRKIRIRDFLIKYFFWTR